MVRLAWAALGAVAVCLAGSVDRAGAQTAEGAAGTGVVREIEFQHIWTGERLKTVYWTGTAYDPAAMARINWFLRDWRCGKAVTMDPALIDLLHDLYREVGARGPIRVLSGYRSEGLNASLLRSGRVVDPNSQHMAGKAVDVVFSGAPLEQLKRMAAARKAGGVGYYPHSYPVFVHVDTGPARDWEEEPASHGGGPLRLDCNLTMAEALREVSLERALAALPPGAASPMGNAAASPMGNAAASPMENGGSSLMASVVVGSEVHAAGPDIHAGVSPVVHRSAHRSVHRAARSRGDGVVVRHRQNHGRAARTPRLSLRRSVGSRKVASQCCKAGARQFRHAAHGRRKKDR